MPKIVDPTITSKRCKICNEVKDLATCYYKAGKQYQSYCKPCCNAKRNTYNPSRREVLSEQDKEKINMMITNGDTLSKISSEMGLPYGRLSNWRKRGIILPKQ